MCRCAPNPTRKQVAWIPFDGFVKRDRFPFREIMALPAALDLMRRLPPKRTSDSINDILDVAGDDAEVAS